MFKKLFLLCAILLPVLMGGAFADDNLPNPIGPADVTDFGMWATENNQKLFLGNIDNEFKAFSEDFSTRASKALIGEYVPVEAKIGRALIGALEMIGDVLDRSLFSFIKIFITILFAFWIFLEAYNLITKGGNAKELGLNIVKKGLLVTVWFIILSNNPAQLFMWIMSPIITLGTMMSNMILDAVTSVSGTSLPDTCATIHDYMAANPIRENIISSAHAADLLCVPTRLSAFFWTCVAAGFKWMGAGFGNSAMTFIIGAVFVIIFLYNIWKFALQALGIIVSLFFAVLFLPFTAIIETFGDGTTYKGPAATLFKAFADMFRGAKLDAQIKVFINAIIYFILLAIMAAIGLALLGEIVTTDLASTVPTIEQINMDDSFMTVLIVGCLVAYLANKAGDIAKGMGATLDKDSEGLTKRFRGDAEYGLKQVGKGAGWLWKTVRGKK
ncbi:MAG: hypothetical protein FWG18_02310 [Alphaproteobacteria bacterium]|nr:hypothetical protein [Alphaproteobacteria bacterium]